MIKELEIEKTDVITYILIASDVIEMYHKEFTAQNYPLRDIQNWRIEQKLNMLIEIEKIKAVQRGEQKCKAENKKEEEKINY